MITNEQLATAQIAQIFGSELLRVQQGSLTDSGSSPNIVKIHPKQFLTNQQTGMPIASRDFSNQKQTELLKMLQQEAESAHPLASPEPRAEHSETNTNQEQHVLSSTATRSVMPQSTVGPVDYSSADIVKHLDRIATCLENSIVTIKKKRTVKRTSK